MKISPCKDCGKRAIGCHAKCQDYIGWKAEQQTHMERRKEALEDMDTTIRELERMKRRRNNRAVKR